MKKRMSGVKRRSPHQQERDFLRRSRAARFAIRQAEGGGAREKARRVKQMVAEQLRAENGVKVVYDTPPRLKDEPWRLGEVYGTGVKEEPNT